MTGNIRIARILGIPINIHVSWVLTLAFITSLLALRYYPETFPRESALRDDYWLHWLLAIGSSLVFFACILAHELAHSLIARRYGIPVREITLFIFGGVSQITREAPRPAVEFVMAAAGPLTSALLGGAFIVLWLALEQAGGGGPLILMVQWLALMNVAVGVFNLAPGFPMDGGRMLRSLFWWLSGDYKRSTRWASLVGRGIGYGLIALGGVATLRFIPFIPFIDPWNGIFLLFLGVFLESSARQSWFQAQALATLEAFKAEELMAKDLTTVNGEERLAVVLERQEARDRWYIFFVTQDDRVVGVLTEKEVRGLPGPRRDTATALEAMVPAETALVARPGDDGATMLRDMESAQVWHLPVVADSRVVGVVSKERLLRVLANRLVGRRAPTGPV